MHKYGNSDTEAAGAWCAIPTYASQIIKRPHSSHHTITCSSRGFCCSCTACGTIEQGVASSHMLAYLSLHRGGTLRHVQYGAEFVTAKTRPPLSSQCLFPYPTPSHSYMHTAKGSKHFRGSPISECHLKCSRFKLTRVLCQRCQQGQSG